MKYFLILILFAVGCKVQSQPEPQPRTKPLSATHDFKPAVDSILVFEEACCFYCSEFKLARISYGKTTTPGTVGYGCVELEWKYHCMACNKPTTGDLDRDFELKKLASDSAEQSQ